MTWMALLNTWEDNKDTYPLQGKNANMCNGLRLLLIIHAKNIFGEILMAKLFKNRITELISQTVRNYLKEGGQQPH